jgi:MEMO1 family protein
MNSVRKSTVSGMFYNEDKTMLEDQITQCFISDDGPGSLPKIKKTTGSIKGIIVPHAGYPFSGAIAAYAYHAVAASGFADVFIILGPNHHGYGPAVAISSGGSWKTPLGEIPVDESIVHTLNQGISSIDDYAMNQRENSIEVQLPFLQFIAKNNPFSIVPLALSAQDKNTARTLGEEIAGVLEQEDRKIILIASTDFSHEGISYGKMPPSNQTVNDYVASQDHYAIEKIQKMDPDGLIDAVYDHQISMCGFGPVATVLYATKILGATTVELLKYGSSYDVHPDNSACVGYASFIIS